MLQCLAIDALSGEMANDVGNDLIGQPLLIRGDALEVMMGSHGSDFLGGLKTVGTRMMYSILGIGQVVSQK